MVIHFTRRGKITVTILTNQNKQIAHIDGQVKYNPVSKSFQEIVPLPNVSTGKYVVKIKTDDFLEKQIPGMISITADQMLRLTVPSMISGDLDNNNKVDINDYNILVSCYGTKFTASSCFAPRTAQSSGADLNDNGIVDGTVDGTYYNLFVRELYSQRSN